LLQSLASNATPDTPPSVSFSAIADFTPADANGTDVPAVTGKALPPDGENPVAQTPGEDQPDLQTIQALPVADLAPAIDFTAPANGPSQAAPHYVPQTEQILESLAQFVRGQKNTGGERLARPAPSPGRPGPHMGPVVELPPAQGTTAVDKAGELVAAVDANRMAVQATVSMPASPRDHGTASAAPGRNLAAALLSPQRLHASSLAPKPIQVARRRWQQPCPTPPVGFRDCFQQMKLHPGRFSKGR